MRNQATVENRERSIEGLTQQEQLKLVEKIAQHLRKAALIPKF